LGGEQLRQELFVVQDGFEFLLPAYRCVELFLAASFLAAWNSLKAASLFPGTNVAIEVLGPPGFSFQIASSSRSIAPGTRSKYH